MSDPDQPLAGCCARLVRKADKASPRVCVRQVLDIPPPSRYLGVGVSCIQRGYLLLRLPPSPLAGQQFRRSLAHA